VTTSSSAPNNYTTTNTAVTLSATGPVDNIWTGGGGFTMVDPHQGSIHIYTTSSTPITGGNLSIGSNVTVNGSGIFGQYIHATSVTVGTGAMAIAATVVPSSSTAVTIAGPVSQVSTTQMTVYAGACCGSMHVTLNSGTLYNGGRHPTNGSYAVVTGSGTLGGSLTAQYVTTYSSMPSTTTVNGKVVAATSYGFTVSTGSLSALPIVIDSKTVVGGGPITTGSTVTITGLGTPTTAVVAYQIAVSAPVSTGPTPAPIAQKHILTADYLGGSFGTHAISWSAAAPYLTWAQTNQVDANAIAATGIKTQIYANPNQLSSTDTMMETATGNILATTCAGSKITQNWNGQTMFVTNPASLAMQSDYANWVSTHTAGIHVDAIFQDGTGALEDYPAGTFSAMPCGYTTSTWLSAEEQLSRAAGKPIIFNGPMGNVTATQTTHALTLLANSAFLGGDFEHCYSDSQQPEMAGWNWQAIETTELAASNMPKLLECMPRNANSAASSIPSRIYTLASFLLTYNPQSSVLAEEYGTPSGFHVLPESRLVPTKPVVSASSISQLLQAGGAYGREYAACFVSGNYVGRCAVVVNPNTTASAIFPFPQYHHTLVLQGSGVLDGGTMSTAGPPPPMYLTARSAAIVF
jgi:hypothetical protein